MRHFGYAAIVLAALAACYFGSYYLLVDRVGVMETTGMFMGSVISEDVIPRYRVGGEVAEWIYAPCHAGDRRIRMKYWSVEEFVRSSTAGRGGGRGPIWELRVVPVK